jgi:prepilin-type N-terminal cleavage/methylation domain-containing protein
MPGAKRREGFTLIELLIVVAIIAILAAIAVPNFLEAQQRAKVARVKADMRSIATAVESYTVDNNRAIPGHNETNPDKGAVLPPPVDTFGDAKLHDWQWSFLTTPIAYITSIPEDEFTQKTTRIGATGSPGYEKLYRFETVINIAVGGADMGMAIMEELKGIGVDWFMWSLGPSRRWKPDLATGTWIHGALAGREDEPGKNRHPSMFYDPTNGTMSFGFLCRSSRGIEPLK